MQPDRHSPISWERVAGMLTVGLALWVIFYDGLYREIDRLTLGNAQVAGLLRRIAGPLTFPWPWNTKVISCTVPPARANMGTIKVNLLCYQMSAGQMPTTEQGLKTLVKRPEREPAPASWWKLFDEVPRDPWGYEYRYRRPGIKHPESFDLFSLGPDGKEGTDDDVWP